MQQSGLIWLLFGYRGRISRSQFWMAPAIYLGGLLVSIILSAVFTWLLLRDLLCWPGGFLADGRHKKITRPQQRRLALCIDPVHLKHILRQI